MVLSQSTFLRTDEMYVYNNKPFCIFYNLFNTMVNTDIAFKEKHMAHNLEG